MRHCLVLFALLCLVSVKARPLDDETGETEEEKRSKLTGVKRAKGQTKVDVPPAPSPQTTKGPTNTKKIIATTVAPTSQATTPAATTGSGGTAAAAKATTAPGTAAVTTPAVTGATPVTTPAATTAGTTVAPATTASVTTAPKPTEKVTTPATPSKSPDKAATKPTVKPGVTTPAKITKAGQTTKAGATTAKPSAKPGEPTKPGGEPTKPGEPTATPKKEEGDVENSPNNTKTMSATTFHVALRFNKETWTDDLQYQVNPVYQSMKRMVQIAIEKIYRTYKSYRQFAIIKFSPDPAGKPGVVVDFYLRFYTAGTHLIPLSEQVKTGVLDTHPVSNKYVRAYPAEPKGRVCTPDCRVQCYSYCDQGCCNQLYHMQVQVPQQQQNLLPPPVSAPAPPVPAPAPAAVAAPAPAPVAASPPAAPAFSLPPAQPAPVFNYSPMPAPVSLTSHCPSECSSYCGPTCPNSCCTSGYQGQAAAAPAAQVSYQMPAAAPAGYAQYPQAYQGMGGGCQQGMPGCG